MPARCCRLAHKSSYDRQLRWYTTMIMINIASFRVRPGRNMGNPSFFTLQTLPTLTLKSLPLIALVDDYIPLQKSLGSADYTLSIIPDVLSTTNPWINQMDMDRSLPPSPLDHPAPNHLNNYSSHCLLSAGSVTRQSTSWILVWELRGNIVALRSDIVAL